MEVHGVPLSVVNELDDPRFDGVVLVTVPFVSPPKIVADTVAVALEIDQALKTEPSVLSCPQVSGRRLVVSPISSISPYDDVRSVRDATKRGMQRALKAGLLKPVFVVQPAPQFPDSELVAILAALETLYVPLQLRETVPEKAKKALSLGVYGENLTHPLEVILRNAVALETARGVGRDIGGGDPERMAPPRVEEYVLDAFAGSAVSVQVLKGHELFLKEYPLFAAADRAANAVPRHQGRILKLEYTGAGPVEATVLLVGKGVTYDTGGADVKTGGCMIGMSRDKCGAAAVAAFFKACALLRPAHLRAVGALGVVRNSIGEECYVADEVVVSRAGRRVRIGNTDAEGRMAMGDLLYEMKELAAKEKNPHIYTIATLTGHALRTVGSGYTIIMDNHVARDKKHAAQFQSAGDQVGDMVEVSTVRREDLATHHGVGEGDDVLQALRNPSVQTNRGHQGPAGFLLLVSGLHEADTPYSHLDILGSAGDYPGEPTSAPLLALANLYNLIKY